jgi:uncharacterized protein YndB with AHSA1/START domain
MAGIEVRASVQIGAPPEKVFDAAVDPCRLGEWVTTHRSLVDEPELPLEEGTEFRQKLRVAGLSFKVLWRITRMERPDLIEWEGRGPGGSRARVCYSLEPSDEGTRFDYVNVFELPGGKLAAKAAGMIGEGKGREEAERSLANLKQLLESESRPASAAA